MQLTDVEQGECHSQDDNTHPRLLVYCDRDDTITVDPGWFGADENWITQATLIQETVELLRYLHERFNITLVIVSNQAGVSLDKFNSQRVDEVNRFVHQMLIHVGIRPTLWIYETDIDAEYKSKKSKEYENKGITFPHIDNSRLRSIPTRKPYASMTYFAFYILNMMPDEFCGAVMIGDSQDDAGFAKNVAGNMRFLQVIDEERRRKTAKELQLEFEKNNLSPLNMNWIA